MSRRWQAQCLLFTEPGKARAKRLPPIPEADISKAVRKLLTAHPAVAIGWRQNTGSGFLVDAPSMLAIMAALGGKAAFESRFGRFRWMDFGVEGASDYIGMLKGGKFLAVEVKSQAGKATDAQRRFLETVAVYGGVSGVVRSVDDVMKLLADA